MTNIAIIVIFIILLITGGILLTGESSRDVTNRRIDRIKKRKGGLTDAPQSVSEMSLRRKTQEAKGLAYWLMKPLPDFKNLGNHLERAGKTITPKQYVLRRALVTLAIIFIMSVIFKKKLIYGVLVGLLIGVWLPLKLLKRKCDKHGRAFLRLFPDAIDLIVRGLRSGLPVSESLVLVSNEVPEPVGSVFGNIANTMKLGVPLEKALQETARKLNLTEFNFFTTSIILQRETGGNLAEILNNLSEVLRSRFIMRMKIKAMSSEARASAYIIGALPFVVIAAVSVISPDYMTPLWDDPRGNICAAVAAGMMTFGMWIMRRMTQFEI